MKKLLIFTLALTLALCSFVDVFADSDNDNVVRLSKSEGTVVITDANGVTKSVPAGGKVLTGYSVATGKDGYAYLTQGEKKLIKLDINTVVTIKQSKNKKKIEVFLESGNVFVNASEKLGSDEQLDIKTTNTTTGLRGTMLEVSVENNEAKNALSNKQAGFNLAKIKEHASVAGGLINDNAKTAEKSVNVSTKINVIEGSVTTTTNTSGHAENGAAAQESKTITLTVGQSASISGTPAETGSSEGNTIEVKPIEPSELRGSTLEELKNVEPERLESLKEEVGAEAIEQEIEQAEEKMEEEQKAAEETAPAAVAAEDVTVEVNTSADNMFAGNQTSDDDDYTPAPSTYTVTLNLGNGSLITDSNWTSNSKSGLTSGTEVTLPNVTPPENHIFKGWFNNADGTGSEITEITVGSSDVTVYAVYEAYTLTYEVTLYLDGGTFEGTTPTVIENWTYSDGTYTGTVTSGTVISLDTIVPTREYAEFDGWYTEAATDGVVTGWSEALTSISVDKDYDIYAKYSDAEYSIKLHLNGGSGKLPAGWTSEDEGMTLSGTGYSKTAFTLPTPTPADDALEFDGWYTVVKDANNEITQWVEKFESIPVGNNNAVELWAKYSQTGSSQQSGLID